jgi:hypothetical protein
MAGLSPRQPEDVDAVPGRRFREAERHVVRLVRIPVHMQVGGEARRKQVPPTARAPRLRPGSLITPAGSGRQRGSSNEKNASGLVAPKAF